MGDSEEFDVIIVGGSYAGLSAAMALGRSMRRVLIIDNGKPCNRQTPHSHNFITYDGEKPAEILKKAKEQVLKYETVEFHNAVAVGGKKTESGFEITTEEGATFQGKKLLFASGVKDLMPNIQGFSECWGISVIHCPYCHGYEVKRQRTGLLANGPMAEHLAKIILNLAKELTIFTNGKATFTQEQTDRFSKNNIQIVEKEIDHFKHENGNIQHIAFKDNSTFELKALYARPPFEQHCKIPASLGCEITELGFIKVDMFQKTTIPNVFACGDNTTFMRSVASAVGAGNMAGIAINNGMSEEEYK